jgi:hypothetical protein
VSAPPVVDIERIDFAALTDQLRILPTSVSWVGVQDSIRMLRKRPVADRHRPEIQDHLRNVEVFAATIREHTELIAYSLACAVALGTVALGASSGPAAREALQTLSRAYNFSALSPREVLELMRRVWAVLRRYARGETTPLPTSGQLLGASGDNAALEPLDTEPPPSVVTSADVAPYFAWLGRVLVAARTRPVAPVVLRQAQRDAWDNVLARCEDAMRARPDGMSSVAEVICAVAKLPPSSVLGLSLRDAPATAWASFVVPDLQPAPRSEIVLPWWSHGIAAEALGFHPYDAAGLGAMFDLLAALPLPTGVRRATDDEAEPQNATFFERRRHLIPQRRVEQALFVIRRDADSLVTGWLASPTVAVLPLTSSQAATLMDEVAKTKSDPGTLFFGPSIGPSVEYVVAVEQVAAPSKAMEASVRLVEMLRRAGPGIRVRRVGFGDTERDSSVELDGFKPRPERFDDLLVPDAINAPPKSSRAPRRK